jgi:hypothetical protein
MAGLSQQKQSGRWLNSKLIYLSAAFNVKKVARRDFAL